MAEKTGKLHMIGHAHLDPVWLWRWTEGLQEAKATFRSALDRLDEDENFCFVSSSAAFYAWIEESDPGMFSEIQQRVSEGRWSLVGGWWVEADCNLPCGESFVRQALYGQRYFQSRFGKKAVVGFNPDSFGHHAMLPQLLKKSGLDYYVFMRPMPHEKGLPSRVFWWESDDGSQVLCYRIPYQYLTWGDDVRSHVLRCSEELRAPLGMLMCFYGVGNHGGGPTRANIDSIHRLAEDPDLPALEFSTPERYFRAVEQERLFLPVIHDELQHHASGCYAAHSGIKQWNRRAENALMLAEKVNILAQWIGGRSFDQGLGQAWKSTLFNQFHDILAGTSLETAYEDARDSFGEAVSIAGRTTAFALQALSWNIDIVPEDNMTPVFVFNPHSWPVTGPVELEMSQLGSDSLLVTESQEPVAWQEIRSQALTKSRQRLAFTAELPPLGYRVFKLYRSGGPQPFSMIDAGPHWLENEHLRLDMDPVTGCIAGLKDKRLGVSVFQGPAARPAVIEDHSDTWSHGVTHFHKDAGQFRLVSMEKIEQGCVQATLRVTSSYGRSRLVQDFVLYRGRAAVEVRVTVDWREQFKMLKLRFPIHAAKARAVSEIPYGSMEREAHGQEEPSGSWVDVSGESPDGEVRFGVAIVNTGKYSYDVTGSDIGLTVLRSPVYAHHDPAVPEEDGQYTFIDQGTQTFSYSICPHEGMWEDAGVLKQALELNQPPEAYFESCHRGSLPMMDSYVQVDSDTVVVSALKEAESGGDMILRCVETARRQTQVTITLPPWGRTIEAELQPSEIKTFRVPKASAEPVTETDLLEEPL